MDCIACKSTLQNVDTAEDNQPVGGTEFSTWGHYGSAVTDLMGEAAHVVNICDPCLVAALADGRAIKMDVNRRIVDSKPSSETGVTPALKRAYEHYKQNYKPEPTAALALAIERVERELPGWWWSVGACHVSSDASVWTQGRASVGPEPQSVLGYILDDPVCDAGFHNDLAQPSSCADALNGAIAMALAYLKEKNLTPTGA